MTILISYKLFEKIPSGLSGSEKWTRYWIISYDVFFPDLERLYMILTNGISQVSSIAKVKHLGMQDLEYFIITIKMKHKIILFFLLILRKLLIVKSKYIG